MVKIGVEQGSQEWLELRRTKVTASDAASIMGVGFSTPYQLWLQKISGAETPVNEHMERGRKGEPLARQWLEELWGMELKPECHLHNEYPWMMASLDGLSASGVLVEIKCPTVKNMEKVFREGIPLYHQAQMQHQMCVVGVKSMIYVCYNPEYMPTPLMERVDRNEEYCKELIEKEKIFYDCLVNNVAPEMTDDDWETINFDPVFEEKANWLKRCRQERETWEHQENVAKLELSKYAQERSVRGYGIKVMKILKKGNVDYSKIPELQGIDLEPYRKNSSTIFRITLD